MASVPTQVELRALLEKNSGKAPVLLVVHPAFFEQVAAMALEFFVCQKNKKTLYVSLRASLPLLCKKFKECFIPTSDILFVDGFGNSLRDWIGLKPKIISVPNAFSLPALSLALQKPLNSGEFDLVFFDSLSALSTQSSVEEKERFVQYVAEKARNQGFFLVALLAVEDAQSKKLLSVCKKQFGRVIVIG